MLESFQFSSGLTVDTGTAGQRSSPFANVHSWFVCLSLSYPQRLRARGLWSVTETYFSSISFVTDFTPGTAFATLTAPFMSSRVPTNPLN
jgi:hypothetical protein